MPVYKRFAGKELTDSRDKNWSKGTWYIRKRLNKKLIHHSLPEAQTQAQAELAERKIIERALNQRYGIRDSQTTFKDFADGPYTRYYKQHNVNQKNKKLYVRYLNDRLGPRILSDITAQDCRDVQWHLNRSMSNSSVNRVMTTLSKIFSLACEEGILERNPMQYVKKLDEPKPRTRLLTAEEKERLWKGLEKDSLMLRLVLLAVNLPLRRGQLLAITPGVIDWADGQLLIIASKGRAPRSVPLNSTAMLTLQQMTSDGQLPFPLKDFRKRWVKILDAADIKDFRFHDLRRYMATELNRLGVPGETIRKLYGHSGMKITQVYISPDMAEMAEAVRALDEGPFNVTEPVQESEGVQ